MTFGGCAGTLQNPTEKLKFSKKKLQPQPTQPTSPSKTANQIERQLTGKYYKLKKPTTQPAQPTN